MGEAQVLSLADGALHFRGRSVPFDKVEGFVERYSTWTGRAWLEVRGPGWKVPMGSGYGTLRAALRAQLPDHPFDSDWSDGRFPGYPGLPVDLQTALAVVIFALLGIAAAWLAGVAGAVAVGLALAWPFARLRDSIGIRREGMRIGPPWAPWVPWHELSAVCWRPRRHAVEIWARGGRGTGRATLPRVLLPAVRARIWRLGGLRIREAIPDRGDRYASWVAATSGLPWGLSAAICIVAGASADPWPILTGGLLALAALTCLGAAIEARATGWGAGSIFGFTGVYAVLLLALGLGTWAFQP